MKSFASIILAVAPLAFAQEPTPYTDADTGIGFNTWSTPSVRYGMALPADALETDATEYIGLLTCASPEGANTGWCGISFGGGMVNNLLLLAYPHNDQVLTSFRWADGYSPPGPYTGEAHLTQISSVVNDTSFSVIYRCQGCLQWKQGETEGAVSTSAGLAVTGWAHATANVRDPDCADSAGTAQHTTQGIMGAQLSNEAASRSYEQWAQLATDVVRGTCGGDSKPAQPSQPAQPPAGGAGCSQKYTVPSGSYCYLIASEHGLSVDQLVQLNSGLDCSTLQPGQEVCVKG
ncbi:hypothetical protein jhhlp_000711 [Lomentospora prolificans]|uniref:LysM domain-containing protein n=1 Tax=Lomentospora prolificans TaxID=41688 RepID=A0A2N3NJA7_9PEZI|nr:hypothetical protein jhhlp_000711 [Lomentospora prolificans]